MRRLTTTVLLVGLAVAPTSQPVGQEKDDALMTRIRREPLAAWSAYSAFAKRLRGKIVAERTDLSKPEPVVSKYITKFSRRDDCELVETEYQSASGERSQHQVMAVNPRYEFELADAAGKGWLLKSIGPPLPPDKRDDISLRVVVHGYMSAMGHLFVNHKYLPEMWVAPGTRLTSASLTTDNGVEAVAIHFAYSPQPKADQNDRPLSGKLVFNPSAAWSVLRCEYAIGTPDRLTSAQQRVYTYRAGRPDQPILERVESEWREIPGGPVLGKVTTICDLASDPNTPVTDFTLSAFGLPEPTGVTWDRPTPYYLYILAAGVGFALMAIILRRFAAIRRRRDEATDKTAR